MKKSSIKTKIPNVVFIDLEFHEDDRGWLIEVFRKDCLYRDNFPQMGYISQTKPGVTRGPHEHINQSDLFCFVGPADFELIILKEGFEKEHHIVGESNPVSVIIPPGVIHSYKNISNYSGVVMNFPNRLFAGPNKLYPIDEIRHEDNKSHYLDTFFV